MKKNKILLLFIAIVFSFTFDANAQCDIVNTAFNSGENISYDLYFNYGLINTRAGD